MTFKIIKINCDLNEENSENMKKLQRFKNKHEFYSHYFVSIPNPLMKIKFQSLFANCVRPTHFILIHKLHFVK